MLKRLLVLAAAAPMFAQLTTTSTTFSAAVPVTSGGTSGYTSVALTSCTGTQLPNATQAGNYLWADAEAMQVQSILSGTIGGSGACTLGVFRGVLGTKQGPHGTAAVVYVGAAATGSGDSARPFSGGFLAGVDPQGTCTASLQYTLPIVSAITARVWTCPTSGPLSGYWAMIYNPGTIYSISDGYSFIPASNCATTVSGNSTGTNGQTVSGGVPVVQADTSNSGTNKHNYICHVAVPSRLRGGTNAGPGAGIAISDVVFLYGVQTSSLGTQAVTLTSGTLNSSIVFQSFVGPALGASETASSLIARADSGSLTLNPTAANFNTGTTTAGEFYTEQFIPGGGPIVMNTDLTDIVVTITLQCAATSATVTQSPGLFVHFITVPL